jgi:hypothetical protein
VRRELGQHGTQNSRVLDLQVVQKLRQRPHLDHSQGSKHSYSGLDSRLAPSSANRKGYSFGKNRSLPPHPHRLARCRVPPGCISVGKDAAWHHRKGLPVAQRKVHNALCCL